MHPQLLSIGPITIQTYGVLAAIGFVFTTLVLRRNSLKAGLDPNVLVDMAFWNLIVGLLGARILFVITEWSAFSDNLWQIPRFWEGGLVFYGGLIGCLPWTLWFLKKHKLNIPLVFDLMASPMALGHGFARLGCLAAGCCNGCPIVSDWSKAWGVRLYSEFVPAHLRGVLLHPVQAYEAFLLFALFGFLHYLNGRKHRPGTVALTYYLSYAVLRFVLEFWRGDEDRGFFFNGAVSTSQAISVVVGLVAGGLLLWLVRRPSNAKKTAALGLLLGIVIGGIGSNSVLANPPPKRIVALAPSLAEMAAEIIGPKWQDQIVGVSQASDFPKGMEKVTSVGPYSNINIETIVGLNPDLILATKDGNQKDQIERLQKLAIHGDKSPKWQTEIISTKNIAEILQSIKQVSIAMGYPESGARIVQTMQTEIDDIKERNLIRSKKITRKLSIFFQLGENPLIVAGPSTFLGDIINTLGASNTFADLTGPKYSPYPMISTEEVIKRDPDKILIVTFSADLTPFKAMASSWHRFSVLKSVKQTKGIALVDGDLISRPSPRLIDGLKYLEKIIYE